jgi:hypothetical protein
MQWRKKQPEVRNEQAATTKTSTPDFIADRREPTCPSKSQETARTTVIAAVAVTIILLIPEGRDLATLFSCLAGQVDVICSILRTFQLPIPKWEDCIEAVMEVCTEDAWWIEP